MIICSCNVLSDCKVRACLQGAASCPRTPAQVYACLGCRPKCGRCAQTIRSILRKAFDDSDDTRLEARSMSPSLVGAEPITERAPA